MPLEPGSPEDWLTHARSDLLLAGVSAPKGVLFENLCFHAQQTVEKSIKAVLVKMGVAFPKTHSIERLIDLLPHTVVRTKELLASASLSAYATVTRYPADLEPVTQSELDEALRLARNVLAWAEQLTASS